MFVYTNAIKKLRRLRKRVKVVPGGTSAGKTYGIIPVLIDRAASTPDLAISIVAESIPHLRKGAMKDFLKVMKDTNRFFPERWHKTLLTYTFANGSYIEFFSADTEQKVRGPRRDILYINECNNLSFNTYHQLAIRTDGEIWLDFNPSNEFWAHKELADDVDADWLTLTYKDNEALSGSIIKEIEKALYKGFYDPNKTNLFDPTNIKNGYWANWWKVYGLGLLGSLEGVIFENWKTIDSVPQGAKLIGRCMDFGYTNDPSTLMAAYKWNNRLIWDEEFYLKGLKNGDMARLLKANGVQMLDTVIAESAEPKSIDEINSYGFTLEPAEKGPDSINFGISVLQEYDMLITKRSTNCIKELRQYCYDRDKTGKLLNKPIDAFNHCIDPMRYLAIKKLSGKNVIDTSVADDAYEQALKMFS